MQNAMKVTEAEMHLGEDIEPLGSSIDDGIMCRQISITSNEDESRCLSPTVVPRQGSRVENEEKGFVDKIEETEAASPKEGVLALAESLLCSGSCEENIKGCPSPKKDLVPAKSLLRIDFCEDAKGFSTAQNDLATAESLRSVGTCDEAAKELRTLERGGLPIAKEIPPLKQDLLPVEGRLCMNPCDKNSKELPLKVAEASLNCNVDLSVMEEFEASISDIVCSPPVVSKNDKLIVRSIPNPTETKVSLRQDETLTNESPKIISRMKTKRRRKSYKETKRKKQKKAEIEITFAKSKGNLERTNIFSKEDMLSSFNQDRRISAHDTKHLPGSDIPNSPGLARTTCVESEADSKSPGLKDAASGRDEDRVDDNSSPMFSVSKVHEIPDISDYCHDVTSICKSPGLDRPVRTSHKLHDNASEDCNKNKCSNETFILSGLKLGCDGSDYSMVSDDVSIDPKSPCLVSVPKTLSKSDTDSTGNKPLICGDALFSPIRIDCDNASFILSQSKHFDSDASDLSDLAPMSPTVVSNPKKKGADSCLKLIESTPIAPRTTTTDDNTNSNNAGKECPVSLVAFEGNGNSSCKIGNSRSFSRNDVVENLSDEGDCQLSPSVVKTEDLRNLDQPYPKVHAVLREDSMRANTRTLESHSSQTSSKGDNPECFGGKNTRIEKQPVDTSLHLHMSKDVIKSSKGGISSDRPNGLIGEEIKGSPSLSDAVRISKENKKERPSTETDKHRFVNKGISSHGDCFSAVESKKKARESSSIVHAIITKLVNNSVAEATERLSCLAKDTSSEVLYQNLMNHPSTGLSDSLLSSSNVIPCTPVQRRKSDCFRLRNSVRIGSGSVIRTSKRTVCKSLAPDEYATENIEVDDSGLEKENINKNDENVTSDSVALDTPVVIEERKDMALTGTVRLSTGPIHGLIEDSVGNGIQVKTDSKSSSQQILASIVSLPESSANAANICSPGLELPESDTGKSAIKEDTRNGPEDFARQMTRKPSLRICSLSKTDDQVFVLSQGGCTPVNQNVPESPNVEHANILKCRNSTGTICDVQEQQNSMGAVDIYSTFEAESSQLESCDIIPGDSLLDVASELEDNKENESERSTFGDITATRDYHVSKETDHTQVASGKRGNNIIDMDSLTQFPFEDLGVPPSLPTRVQTKNNDTTNGSAVEMISKRSEPGTVFEEIPHADRRKNLNRPKLDVKAKQPIQARSYSSDSSTADILDDLMFGNQETNCIKKKDNKGLAQGFVCTRQRVAEIVESNLEGNHADSSAEANSKQAVEGAGNGCFGGEEAIAAATSCSLAVDTAQALKPAEKSELGTFAMFKGFTTGSGKPLKASDDALKAARKLLADFERDEIKSRFAAAKSDGVIHCDTAIHRKYDDKGGGPRPILKQCWNDEMLPGEFDSNGAKFSDDKFVERRDDLSNTIESGTKFEVGSDRVKLSDDKIVKQRKDLSNMIQSETKLGVYSDRVKLSDAKIVEQRNDLSNEIESDSQLDFALGDSLVPVSDDSEFKLSTCNVSHLNKEQDLVLEHEDEVMLSFVNSSFDIDDFTQLRDSHNIRKPVHRKPTLSQVAVQENFDTGTEAVAAKSSCDNSAASKRKPESSNCGIKDTEAENSRVKHLSYQKEKLAEFSVGTGKKVELSKDTIEAAKNRLPVYEDLGNPNPDCGKEEKFIGFSTGSGKRIQVSNEAIERARRRLEVNEEVDSVGSCKGKDVNFTGFSTASGKKVELSEEAIERARRRLGVDEELNEVDTFDSKGSKFTVFSTGSGKKVQVSKEAIERAKRRLEVDDELHKVDSCDSNRCKFAGLSTGSGTKIEVSRDAIERAKKRLGADEELGQVGSCDRRDTKFIGVSTGSGKNIEVSKEAIERAKKRLGVDEEPDQVVSCHRRETQFTGFNSGSGKKAEVSKEFVERAKIKLGADEEVSSSHRRKAKFTGFSNGSGKKVEVSKEAIERAKNRLGADEEPDEAGSCHRKQAKFTGISTGSGKKVQVSKEAIERAKTKPGWDEELYQVGSCDRKETNFTGFRTGSGKKVEVSKEAIERAKERLEADEEFNAAATYDGKETKFTGFSTGSGKKVEVPKEAIERAKERLEADDEFNVAATYDGKEAKFTGFSTGSGKKVEVSKEAIERAKERLGADEELNAAVTYDGIAAKFTGFSTGSGKKVEVSKEAIAKAKKRLGADEELNAAATYDGKEAKFTGFSTGSGRKVEVSKEAIEKAKKRLGADEELNAAVTYDGKEAKFTGFSTGSGKKVEVSKEAIERAKERLEADEEMCEVGSFSFDKRESKFTGFSTASGKKVEVSKEAIERAKKRLGADEELDHVGSFDRKEAKCTEFSTGSGKKIEVSTEAIEAAKRRLETSLEDEIVDLPANESEMFAGFSTGVGKKVLVSEQALEVAKKTVESEGVLLQGLKTGTSIDSGLTEFHADAQSKAKMSEEALFDPKRRLKPDETRDRKYSNPKKRLSLNRCAGKKPQRVTETHFGGKWFIDDRSDITVGKTELKRTMESESCKKVDFNDDSVEMIERCDHDISNEMEEDPQLLSTGTRNLDAANFRSEALIIRQEMAAKEQARFAKHDTQVRKFDDIVWHLVIIF